MDASDLDALRTRDYWEKRYNSEPAEHEFDWFKSYDDLAPWLNEILRVDHSILMLGCGNSRLSSELYKRGFKNIQNIDFSEAVIHKMSSKYSDMPEMTWKVMDVRDLKIESSSIDVAIDKGTMDALLCSSGSVWSPSEEIKNDCRMEVDEVIRVLKPGGRAQLLGSRSENDNTWRCYINYKALKKLIKALETGSPRGPGYVGETTYPSKQSALQANKAAFFFRLERELEKVNAFYLQKEAELKSRLKVLSDKKAIVRSQSGTISRNSAVLISLKEGYQIFERDLSKLQQFIELNATGFAKALKKWDKRSKSQTKELYLSRQVEVQPVFNRDVIAGLSDSAVSSLLELDAWINGEDFIGSREAQDEANIASQIAGSQMTLTNLESEMIIAIENHNTASAANLVSQLSTYAEDDRRTTITTVFLRVISDGPIESLNYLLDTGLVDTSRPDEITDRGCLHEAAIAGRLDVLKVCIDHGADVQQVDLHGRLALHYACRNGHEDIAEYLLSKGSPPDHPDHDGLTPMTMAVISGKTNCVHQLLEFNANVDSLNESSIPLNLACQYGQTDIADLLLTHNPKIASNSEGLYPLHLAARAGNKEILRALMRYDSDGINVQERFSLWTPLFFAASEGHDDCVKELLQSGASLSILDDSGHSAMYWAAWTGHLGCMNLLFEGGARPDKTPSMPSITVMPSIQNVANIDDQEIPSLSLPPPIIPSFGHNFLEKKVFVQFRLGKSRSPDSPTIQPVLLYNDASLTSAKLTISPKGCDDIVPRSVLLPLTDDDQRSVSFYVDKIENFSIDFELYPTFGSKVIGKGSALGDVFAIRNNATQHEDSGGVFCTLPIFDSRLKVVGEVSFEFSIIKPFQGVQLEIGGKVETYWKSTRPLQTSITGTPSLQSSNSGTASQSLVTASSLSGQFARVFIQVTRDLVPVAYPSWRLPVEGLNLGVSQVTYSQFQTIISKSPILTAPISNLSSVRTASEAQTLISSSCFTSLTDLLSSLPLSIHLNLQILYATSSERERLCIDFVPEINDFVDSILQAVFESAESSQNSNLVSHVLERSRSILFSSFNPDICTALNWKQPNYAVFFANYIGDETVRDDHNASAVIGTFPASEPLSIALTTDWRSRSIRDAVKFAKSNNLLGLICQARLLLKVPALIQSIKEGGLVLITYGSEREVQECRAIREGLIDGFMINGVLGFSNAISV